MTIIERLRQAFQGEQTSGEIEELIADASEAHQHLVLDADAAHKRLLDLSNDSPDDDRQDRDRLRAEAERIAAAINQLKTVTLPEAAERELQSARRAAYETAKQQLDEAVEADKGFERQLNALRSAMTVNDEVRAAVAAVNSALPHGAPVLDCQLPLSVIPERILTTEQCLVWCDAGSSIPIDDSEVGQIADDRMHGARQGGVFCHRHVAIRTTSIPAHSRLEEPKPTTTVKVGARVEALDRDRQQALLADELQLSAQVAIRMGGRRMTVSRHDLASYLEQGGTIDDGSHSKIRVIR